MLDGAWEFSLLEKPCYFFQLLPHRYYVIAVFLQIKSKRTEDAVFTETSKRAGAFSLQRL